MSTGLRIALEKLALRAEKVSPADVLARAAAERWAVPPAIRTVERPVEWDAPR